ncbi:Non-specific DNA-binding protein Dps [Burkholderia sp. AU4i]|nr:Non-specific DNA-binding protein Dps [Burkholderia sp. AU4i]
MARSVESGRTGTRTFGDFAKLSSVPEAKGVRVAEDMIREPVEGHEAVVRTRARDLSDRRRGEPTADLRTHEKPRGCCARCSRKCDAAGDGALTRPIRSDRIRPLIGAKRGPAMRSGPGRPGRAGRLPPRAAPT